MDVRPPEPRQRWRLVVAREVAALDLLHRDVVTAWEAAMVGSGLPVSMSEAATPRPRIAFAAQAPVGVLAERELIDVVVTDLLLIHQVRDTVAAAAPAGYRLVDLYDAWLWGPTLASLVTAGDYRATVAIGDGVAATMDIETAIEALLAAPVIERLRTKGRGEVTVDIRPHLLQLRLAGEASTTFALWMRLRLGGEGGIGRPDEIVAAIGERLGVSLAARDVTRERIVLADDPDT